MTQVHCRIHGFSDPRFAGRFDIWVKLIPDGVATPSALDSRISNHIWTMEETKNSDAIDITIKKSGFMGKAAPIYRTVLPLLWFPLNTVCREKFGIKSLLSQYRDMKVDVEIHIHNDRSRPFEAPKGNLLCYSSPSVPRSSFSVANAMQKPSENAGASTISDISTLQGTSNIIHQRPQFQAYHLPARNQRFASQGNVQCHSLQQLESDLPPSNMEQ